jgi:hypothetical protein
MVFCLEGVILWCWLNMKWMSLRPGKHSLAPLCHCCDFSTLSISFLIILLTIILNYTDFLDITLTNIGIPLLQLSTVAPCTIPLPTSPRSNISLSPYSPPESSPLANRHCPRIASDMSLESPGSSTWGSGPLLHMAGVLIPQCNCFSTYTRRQKYCNKSPFFLACVFATAQSFSSVQKTIWNINSCTLCHPIWWRPRKTLCKNMCQAGSPWIWRSLLDLSCRFYKSNGIIYLQHMVQWLREQIRELLWLCKMPAVRHSLSFLGPPDIKGVTSFPNKMTSQKLKIVCFCILNLPCVLLNFPFHQCLNYLDHSLN